jgi:16S rRNA (cytidine1402-2'-O)-methyltransferase
MGTVHVVATPIGNLEDITLRALRVLAEADLVFAEDTRHTRILLDHHGIKVRTVSLNSNNEQSRIARALEALQGEGRVAVVSDAGTPLISDPGGRLVEAAAEAGHRVEAIPGASAVLAALSVSGLRAQPFTFLGFPPRKSGARRKLFGAQRGRAETLVIFESPHRVGVTLAELAESLGGERRACVARELTKLHEEVVRAPLAELAARFAEGGRGEFTLVVEGDEEAAPLAPGAPQTDEELEQAVRRLVAEGRRPREIAALLAPTTHLPRRDLYARAVAARAESEVEAAEDPEAGEATET